MSLIFNNNILEPSNIDTITHTVASGSITALSEISNVINRSIFSSYIWTSSDYGSLSEISITLTSTKNISSFSILSAHTQINDGAGFEIQLLDITDAPINTLTAPDARRIKYENGIKLADLSWAFTTAPDVKKIVVNILNSDDESGVLQIGSLFAGDFKTLNISPKSLTYSFGTQGQKDRTEGGQIIASRNNSYMKASFKTVATSETSVVNDYFDINYQSSISEPIIFIPQIGKNIILYGTQEKPNTTRALLAKDGGEWLYETQFQIEEEF